MRLYNDPEKDDSMIKKNNYFCLYMKTLFRKITNIGVHNNLSATELRLLILLNTILFIIDGYIIINALVGLSFYSGGGKALVLFNIFHFVTISFTFLFNYWRKYLLAKLVFCGSALLFVSIYGIYFGERGFAGYFLSMLVFVYFIIFSKKELKSLLVLVVLTAGVFLYTIYRYENLPLPIGNPSIEFLKMFRLNNMFGFIGLAIAFGFYSFSVVNDTENKLQLEKEKSEELLEHFQQSVKYANRIQTALLGDKENITRIFKDAFILFKPKDIVSGDFYWHYENEQYQIVVAADCTGHGVPGAFLTILGVGFLNDIVKSKNVVRPDQLLSELDKKVLAATQNQLSELKINDGMDITVVTIDKQEQIAYVAGANNPVFYVSENKLVKIKGSKYPIGSSHYENKFFEETKIPLQTSRQFYLFSDGFQDQFGGPDNKKYLTKRFANLVESISSLPMNDQLKKLENELSEWKRDYKQVDDILVIGIKI